MRGLRAPRTSRCGSASSSTGWSAASARIARDPLNRYLKSLVDAGLLERRRYQERPERFEYRRNLGKLGHHADVARFWHVVRVVEAGGHGIRLLLALGDQHRLHQVVANLLANARTEGVADRGARRHGHQRT